MYAALIRGAGAASSSASSRRCQLEAIRQELDAEADKANKRPFMGPFMGT
jgi:hypothetical protein